MNQNLKRGLFALVHALLFFAVFCVLPFAWILKDGLGPNSVTTTGLESIFKAFMTFYVGPVILVLIATEILLRKTIGRPEPASKNSQTIGWTGILLLIAGLSVVFLFLFLG